MQSGKVSQHEMPPDALAALEGLTAAAPPPAVHRTEVEVGTPQSKQALAETYLRQHSDAMLKTLRELEAVTPEGVTISRNTWSKAKRAVIAEQ